MFVSDKKYMFGSLNKPQNSPNSAHTSRLVKILMTWCGLHKICRTHRSHRYCQELILRIFFAPTGSWPSWKAFTNFLFSDFWMFRLMSTLMCCLHNVGEYSFDQSSKDSRKYCVCTGLTSSAVQQEVFGSCFCKGNKLILSWYTVGFISILIYIW